MKKLIIFLTLLVIIIFGACKSTGVKIGVLMAFTGDLADYGNDIKKGCTLAADDINNAGGILGKKVAIIERDSQTDPTMGVDAAKKLISIDGVSAIIGALSSGVTIPITSEAIKANIVQISPASTSPEITKLQDKDLIYRTCPSDSLQGVVLADIAKNQYNYNKVSIIYVNNDYGVGLNESFKQAFESRGGKVIASVPYQKGISNYNSEIAKALNSGGESPDAIGIFGYPENGQKIIRNILEVGNIKNIFYADGLKSNDLFESLSSPELEGTWGTASGSVETDSLKIFNEKYNKKFGKKPPKPYITNAYDALAIIALAMVKANSTDPAKYKEVIRFVANAPGEKILVGEFDKAFKLLKEGKDIDYVGAAGEQEFDANGDVSTPFVIWEVKNSTVVEVKTINAPTK